MKCLSYYLVPDLMCQTVYDIPFRSFEEKGLRLVIFDIDNTLVSYETPEPDEKLKRFLRDFSRRGVEVALVSNNSPQRVERFNRELGFFAVPDAHKPSKNALESVMKHFSIPKEEILFVGDQLLTDAWTARLWDLRAVVVEPIQKRENLFFRFKRVLEKPFVRIYRKRNAEKGENR
ncbi:MAG: YqeG family HAD IIIA-type phosphatase [Clostridia bacterium]|nr:YqeG family HAD IIIA-type phosphatase [Clostridia bacterium]